MALHSWSHSVWLLGCKADPNFVLRAPLPGGCGRCPFVFKEGPASVGSVSLADVPDFLDALLLVFFADPCGLAGGTGPATSGRVVPPYPSITPGISSPFPKGWKRSSRTVGDIFSWGSQGADESWGLIGVGSRMGSSVSWSRPGSDFARFSGFVTSSTGVLVRSRFLAAASVPLIRACSTRFPKSLLKIQRNFKTQSSRVRQSRSSGGAWTLLSRCGTSSCRLDGLKKGLGRSSKDVVSGSIGCRR